MSRNGRENGTHINQVGRKGVCAEPRLRATYRPDADATSGEPYQREIVDGETRVSNPFRQTGQASEGIYREDSPDGLGLAGGEYEFEAGAFSLTGPFANEFHAQIDLLLERGVDPQEIFHDLRNRIERIFIEQGNQEQVDNAAEYARAIASKLLRDHNPEPPLAKAA